MRSPATFDHSFGLSATPASSSSRIARAKGTIGSHSFSLVGADVNLPKLVGQVILEEQVIDLAVLAEPIEVNRAELVEPLRSEVVDPFIAMRRARRGGRPQEAAPVRIVTLDRPAELAPIAVELGQVERCAWRSLLGFPFPLRLAARVVYSSRRGPAEAAFASPPRRCRTKKSRIRRTPYSPPMPWLAFGTTSISKSLPALIKASTSRMVDSGGTFVSISPTIRSSLPRRFFALSIFDDSEYQGPTGYPIHCSFHDALSIRLSWQPQAETAAL